MQRVSRFLKLAPCCIVVAIVIVADAVLGQSLSERRINPGHAGAWLNPETSGQGFLLDVLPETDMAFLAWFTYDTVLPDPSETAQVGDPGHRWLIAQGPLDGSTAHLDAYVTSGGIFDDGTAVVTTPEGTVTLSFEDCDSGLVEYDFPSADVSGSVPISRIANDNVALCESLCNEAVEESGKQSGVYGLGGGVLEVVDSKANVSQLTLPEGGLIGTPDHLIEAFPLAQEWELPSGHYAIAGLQWSSEPNTVIGPARLEILSIEVARYPELAAFFFEPLSGDFYFLPLNLTEDFGVVLEVPLVYPGTVGLTLVSADEMAKWTPPDRIPKAKYLQGMAVALKRMVEADTASARFDSNPQSSRTRRSRNEHPTDTEQFLPFLIDWFDEAIKPKLSTVDQGCDIAKELVFLGIEWHGWIESYALEGHESLQSRVDELKSAYVRLGPAAEQDLMELALACERASGVCEQMQIMAAGTNCALALKYVDIEVNAPDLECSNTPSVMTVNPKNAYPCVDETINFSAQVRDSHGRPVAQDEVTMRWSVDPKSLMTIDEESGEATALRKGRGLVWAKAGICGETLKGRALVKIDSVPDLSGSYSLVGTESVRGCDDPLDNGSYESGGSATITMGPEGEQPETAGFSGSSSGAGLGHDFQGTVNCAAEISGSGNYVERTNCGEYTCVTKGTNTFTGSVVQKRFKPDVLVIEGSGHDTSGDSCSFEAWGTATRND